MKDNLKSISITFFVIMVVLSIIQWVCLQNNISSIKSDLLYNYEKIESRRSEPIVLDFKKVGKNQVAIDEDGLRKINEQIKTINQELEKQSIKLESTVDKDISRLGLYMAMGIGFMTLFGIFAPILINVLSTQDLRDKQKGIDDDFKNIKSDFELLKGKEKDIENAIENSAKALSDSNTAIEKSKELDKLVEKQEKIELRAKSINPEVCNLVLHNSIARFFNIRPLLLTNAVSKKDNSIFINHLTHIQSAFSNCESEENHLIKSQQFQETIRDFIIYLRTESILQSILSTKTIFNEIDSLAEALDQFFNISEEDKSNQYKLVNEKIELLKVSIENQHVKDKPTA